MMKSFWFFAQFLHVFLVFSTLIASVAVQAFTGAYGINYGRIADNIPSPDKVATLLRAAKIKNVRIYDADHSVLKAFSGTGLDLVVGLPNGYLKDMSANEDHAMDWVKENVQAFLPETRIRGIAVGNEVLGGTDYELWGALLGAVKNIYNAIKELGLTDVVQITTAHSQASNVKQQYMKPLLEFFSEIGSPFCLNAYPFLAYMSDPENIDINYALFQKTQGISDPKTDLHYDNMLDAQIDAAYAALEDAGFKKMEVIITETGWASRGDDNEAAATNLKPGPTSERNFGLYKPDGTIAYDIGFRGLVSSSADSLRLSSKDLGARGWSRSQYLILPISMAAAFLLFLR
ncbi:glucan endo-1 3-beta-glucosidase 14-like [Prunus yedoensis var. nudiflora]|uniref:glucan endo-1,3-beta-D-glucosidase n=1 Tax=Prunus yedoensis var. nudiflora TaxID=2094558 RepID=A0A314XN69_PRUYE|nr:glucan endo-1 3-beta-glucosidase 14-like [Prunus yedoensis var. nudiflora]